MSRTTINVGAVIDADSQINSAKSSVSSSKSSFSQTKNSIDGKIQNRSDIRNRLATVHNQLSSIDSQIGKIRSMVQAGANLYRSTDDTVESWRGEIKNAVGACTSSGVASNWASQFRTSNTMASGLNYLAKVVKGVGKYTKSDKMTLSSSFLSYLGTLHDVFTSKNNTGVDVASSLLSLFKSSASVEKGIFDYYEKTLHPYEAAKLDAKFGKAMTGVKLASDVAGTAKAVLKAYEAYNDPDSTAYDRAAETIKIADPALRLGSDIYIASNVGTKTLQFVSTTTKSGKVVNQILDQPALKYTTSKAAATKIKNINAGVTIGSAVISGISSGVKQYGEVTADGTFDMGDAGSVGLNFGLSGLDSMVSSLTFGIVDFDAEKVADDLEADADEFVRGDSWAAQYIRNKDKNIVYRFGVSIGSAVYILGENVVDGISNGFQAVGSWFTGSIADDIATLNDLQANAGQGMGGSFTTGGGYAAGGGGGGFR